MIKGDRSVDEASLLSSIAKERFPPAVEEAWNAELPGWRQDLPATLDRVLDLLLREPDLEQPRSDPTKWRAAFPAAFNNLISGNTGHLQADLLTGRALAKIREVIKSESDGCLQPRVVERVCRAAQLWDLLKPDNVDANNQCDPHGRWWPDCSTEEKGRDCWVEQWLSSRLQVPSDHFSRRPLEEISRALYTIHQSSGWSYRVLFPVVIENTYYHRKTPGIVEAWVTTLKSEFTESLPTVVLAPWSRIVLQHNEAGDWLQVLRDGVAALAGRGPAELRSLFQGSRFLLELAPVCPPSKCSPCPVLQLPRLDVQGDSLGLAVVLAAWAASKGRTLRRMIVTGAIDINSVGRVEDVGIKFDGACQYWQANAALNPDCRCLFLYPSACGSVSNANSPSVDLENIDGWADLFKKHDKLLGDGFHDYRHVINNARDTIRGELRQAAGSADKPGTFLEEDLDEFDAAAERVYQSLVNVVNPAVRPAMVCLPFDNEPAAVARRMVAELVDRLVKRDEKLRKGEEQGSSSADLPVPMLLPTEDAPEDIIAFLLDRIQSWVERGLQSWTVVLPNQPPVDPEILQNAVRGGGGWGGRLLLVVYSKRSSELSHAAEQEKLDTLQRYMKNRRHRLLFIASDYHHGRLLTPYVEQEMGAKQPAAGP